MNLGEVLADRLERQPNDRGVIQETHTAKWLRVQLPPVGFPNAASDRFAGSHRVREARWFLVDIEARRS